MNQKSSRNHNISITPFQAKVYEAVRLIPAGKVTTYKHLAHYINCGSYQAVGQALRNNPYAPEVACHRVIASSRQVGGFIGARTGEKIDKKRVLLESEGVRFDGKGRVLISDVIKF